MEKYLYLALDIVTILIPFLASFYPKAPFYRKWKYLFPAIVIPAALFALWDASFTQMNVWHFNERYLTGIKIGNLPVEEILFFICIPYACVFTYFALNYLIKKDFLFPYRKPMSAMLIAVLLTTGFYHVEKWYTSLTFLLLGLTMIFQMLTRATCYMGRFYFAYAVILLPFFAVNSILTGSLIEEEVVWYNDAENLGIRLGTIPVEDIFYGMLLVLTNVMIYEAMHRWRERYPATVNTEALG
jgi:lycopene cyclase domain-containing protein